ncbi:MAG: GNAT family N-acetyltransferase [Pseudomonadota bacterium]|jgi:N-acetylglutamate synthase-like GNAT family acetyltransferase
MSELELRRAVAGDGDALEELQRDSIVGVAAAHYTHEQVEAFLRFTAGTLRTHIRRAHLWVLSEGGRLVACAGWRPCGAMEDHVRGPVDPAAIEVRSVYVRPDRTRRGLAARLLERVEREAAASGARRANLHAMRGSEAFYAARGYAPVSAMSFDMGGVPFPGLEMTKPLDGAAPPTA